MFERRLHPVTENHLRELVAHHAPGPCLSLYVAPPPEPLEAPRLVARAAMERAREALEDVGTPGAASLLDALETPLREALGTRPEASVAAFVARDESGAGGCFTRVIVLPEPTEDLALVGARFHVAPLLRYVPGESYHVLAIGLGGGALHLATRWGIVPEEADIDRPLEAVLGHELSEPQLNAHSTSPRPGDPSSAAAFHGHGEGAPEERKREARKYFRELDRRVKAALGDDARPIVLVGQEHLAALYRDASHLADRIVAVVAKEPSAFESVEALRREAWEAYAQAEGDEPRRRLEEAPRDAVATDAAEVVRAAMDGRVAHFFLTRGARRFGRWEPGTREVRFDESPPRSERELFGEAATKAWEMGAMVHVLDPEQMPADQPIAATLRY